MAAKVDHYDRRDGADREALGRAALTYCRVIRAQPGITNSNFYWSSADAVAVVTFGESAAALEPGPKPEMAKAVFGLADVARRTGSEHWTEARDGEAAYRMRG